MRFRVLAMIFLAVMLVGSYGVIPTLPMSNSNNQDLTTGTTVDSIPEELMPLVEQVIAGDNPYLPADFDIGDVLGDRVNDYQTVYEPWKSKAAIHAIAYDEATGFLALAGGYLYDNEIHLFRHNIETNEFDKVWDTGDGVFMSDIISLDFGDTDLNDFIEIVAGSSDGHVYVFEQRHLYDPYANTENQFDLVWTSPKMFRVFAVRVDDIDRDYRPDIIAGGWDGKVHIYEYAKHSGYPFVADHWITYDEVATLEVGDKVYSLETGDTNGNGLPEVIVGTRNGTVYVFENDGITLWINGFPFPLIYDNHYYLNWTSQSYTWSPIISMAVGELDGSLGDEIALVAQGQGVFTLDWDSSAKTYKYQKIYKAFKPWETFGYWGLDYWADRVVEAWNVTYHDPINGTINVPEPIQYVWNGAAFDPDASVYPFNSGMAYTSDGNFSTFDASDPSVDNATAIIDFGLDEEGTGSANADPDVWIKFPGLFIIGADISDRFNFSISRDGTDFEQVSPDCFTYSGYYLKVDVDDALGAQKWDYFRYAKISVFNGATLSINSLELKQVYNLVTDALSVTIGQIKEDGDLWAAGGTELDKIMVGTVIGELIGVKYNTSTHIYDLFWESGDDDYWTYGTNIWDIQQVNTPSDLPNWNLIGGANLNPTPGYDINSWGYGMADPLYEGDCKIYLAENLPGGGDPQITVREINGVADPTTQAYLSWLNSYIAQPVFGFDTVSVESPLLINPLYGSPFYPMIVVGGIDYDTPIDSEMLKYRGNIFFFYRSDGADDWAGGKELWQLDSDGQLSGLVNLAKTTPRMDFADYDGDGDLDFVVSNGYVYLAENIQDETGKLNFTLHTGYFDDINNIETASVWGQPDFQDLDGDGDMDLILSYDNKYGATAFINEGTAEDPVWVEQKKLMSNPGELTNLKLLNMTNVRMIPDYGAYFKGMYLEWYHELLGDDKPEYYMYCQNAYTNGLLMSDAEYGSSDSYIIATYPKVARLQVNLMEGSYGSFYNLGFHVVEDWNNENDLEDWTLTITSADTDQDGHNEIIVGDYDNNVYAFEHLLNNTYKRMFRSFDLNHSESSDVSPYAYEDLEGISGDFNRRIWDHAEHLVADVDLDNDGLKEIIVAADLQVYIFEEIGLFGGDAMRFVYSIDLRDTVWGDRTNFETYATKITAMAAGDDIDYDGRYELAVAAGPYLFIYNVNQDSFTNMEDNEFFVTSPVMEGRYWLAGNGDNSNYKYYQINAMTLCDTDKDGYREVIIGGIQDIRLDRQNGFVYIYECVGGTFQRSWIGPNEIVKWNPISVLLLDDQDYDGETEIIIGHTNGFDMWEHVAGEDNTYQKVEYVTASPNYPIIPLTTTQYAGGGDTYLQSGRSLKSLAHVEHPSYSNFDMMVYESALSTTPILRFKYYQRSTGLWTPGADLPVTYPPSNSITSEFDPHITWIGNRMYFTWNTGATNGSTYLWITYFDYETAGWGPVVPLPRYLFEFGVRTSPSVFKYDSTHVGVAYIHDGFGNQVVLCKVFTNDLTGVVTHTWPEFENRYDLSVHDAEMIQLDDGSFILAMSATNVFINKLDYDIWTVWGNSSFNFEGQYPHQASTSFHDDMFVDVDYMRTEDKSLVVCYEAMNDELEDKFKMVASQNLGSTWGIPESLNSIPDWVVRTEHPGGYVTYSVSQPTAYSPAFMARPEGGFLYATTFAYIVHIKPGDIGYFRVPVPDIYYGINPQSDWALNSLRDVVDLDVGDTDSDGRREVVVGFDHQIGVYELDSSTNGSGFMTYLEDWLSAPYEYPVTGVTVSDSNNNGWDDIALSCERGDVFIIEFLDVSEGDVLLQGSAADWTYTMAGYPWFSGYKFMASYDLDSDGKDEVIAANYDVGTVVAIDDDGSQVWNNTDSSAGFRRMNLFDINNDTIPEVLLAGKDDMLWVLDITDGTEVLSFDAGVGDVTSIDVADANGDGEVEIVFGTTGDYLVLLDNNGTQLQSWSLALGDMWQVKFGNFTGGDHLDVAFVAGSRLCVMNPFNGTIYYQSSTGIASSSVNLHTIDYTNDDIDDIIYANNAFHILDVLNHEIVYNSTTYDAFMDVWVEDFDSDGAIEIVGQTWVSGIFMEDLSGGVLQWQYNPTNENFWPLAMEIGYFGGSGEFDIALGIADIGDTDGGIIVVLDGQNGIPIWFNRTGGTPYHICAADILGNGIDSAITWDFISHDIMAVSGYERVVEVAEDVYPAHQIYWDREFANVTISATAVGDVNGDGFDEVVVMDNNVSVYMLNGTNGAVIWGIDLGVRGYEAQIGNMDNSGWLDVVVRGKTELYILSGDNGALLGIIDGGSHNPMAFYVRNFSGTNIGDEVAVLFYDGVYSFVGWYDKGGSVLYHSSMNITADVDQMAVGNILGTAYPDVIVGGDNEAALIFRGTNGVFHHLYDFTPRNVIDIVVGNLTGDAYADFVLRDVNYDLYFINGQTNAQFVYLNFIVPIHEIEVGDLDGNGKEEVVVNTEKYGVYAYNESGMVDWYFQANLLVNHFEFTIEIADMDLDGADDVIMTNSEYINVISGATNRLLWHYVSDARNVAPKAGHFVSDTGPLDLLSSMYGRVYAVSGIYPAPIPPEEAVLGPIILSHLEAVLVVASIAIPISVLLIVPGVVVWRRKKRIQ